MTMRPMPTVRAALFALIVLYGPAAMAGAEAPYPIWWSPELGLKNLDDIDWKLEERFPRMRWYEVVAYDSRLVYTDVLKDETHPEWGYNWETENINLERRTINDCLTLKKWRDKGFNVYGGAYGESPYALHAGRLDSFYSGYCYTLSALKNAKPSNKSFLRDFSFDEDYMDYMPPMVRLGWGCRGLNKFLQANRNGVSWREFRHEYYAKGIPNYDVTIIDQKSIAFDLMFEGGSWGPDYIGETVRITITGQGDFNGDGLDDLLIRREFSNRVDGEMVTLESTLYVVTRNGTNSILRVVDLIIPPYEPLSGCNARNRIIESGSTQ